MTKQRLWVGASLTLVFAIGGALAVYLPEVGDATRQGQFAYDIAGSPRC